MRNRLELKAARVRKGLRQSDLAELINVSQQTIAKWEIGKSSPRTLVMIRHLSTTLETPMETLFPDIFAEEVPPWKSSQIS